MSRTAGSSSPHYFLAHCGEDRAEAGEDEISTRATTPGSIPIQAITAADLDEVPVVEVERRGCFVLLRCRRLQRLAWTATLAC